MKPGWRGKKIRGHCASPTKACGRLRNWECRPWQPMAQRDENYSFTQRVGCGKSFCLQQNLGKTAGREESQSSKRQTRKRTPRDERSRGQIHGTSHSRLRRKERALNRSLFQVSGSMSRASYGLRSLWGGSSAQRPMGQRVRIGITFRERPSF